MCMNQDYRHECMTFAIPWRGRSARMAVVNGSLDQCPRVWDERGVLSTTRHDLRRSQCQLKNLAFMAWHGLRGLGAGFEPVFTNGGTISPRSISGAQGGARPFYDESGSNNGIGDERSPADDFSPATIGQAKYLFSLEWRCAGILQDGMRMLGLENGLIPETADASTDHDSDGAAIWTSGLMGSSPTMRTQEARVPQGFNPQKGAGEPVF